MARRRHAMDHEALQRVLVLGGVLLVVAGLGVTVWGLLVDAKGLFVGPLLVAFAAACLVVSRDDGTGTWCEACVARNAEDAEVCASCGAWLG